MPPGDFALKAKQQLPQGNLSLIAFGDVNLPAGKFTSPKAINDKLPCGNCDFAFRAKSPGGIVCRPYTEGKLKLTPLPRGKPLANCLAAITILCKLL